MKTSEDRIREHAERIQEQLRANAALGLRNEDDEEDLYVKTNGAKLEPTAEPRFEAPGVTPRAIPPAVSPAPPAATRERERESTPPAVPGVASCLFPGCGEPPKTRGLCPSHYFRAAALRKAGRVTFEDLVARGKMLPRGGSGRAVAEAWFLDGEKA